MPCLVKQAIKVRINSISDRSSSSSDNKATDIVQMDNIQPLTDTGEREEEEKDEEQVGRNEVLQNDNDHDKNKNNNSSNNDNDISP
jgi:hypothetical protein